MILVMSCITTFPAKISGYIFKYVFGLCLVMEKMSNKVGVEHQPDISPWKGTS